MNDTSGSAVEIVLQDGMRFEATGDAGIEVQLDSTVEHGGEGSGFRPMELLLVGLGTCTAMDVISILRKKRQAVTSYRIQVTGTQTADHPRIFSDIHVRHIFAGANLVEGAIARAIELSESKYCPAFAMLSKAAHITSGFEVEQNQPTD